MGGWRFVLYPDAAEGVGAFRSGWARSGYGSGAPPTLDESEVGPWGDVDDGRSFRLRASDGEALSDRASDPARRARGTVRRYCAANRLTRLGTLTYAGEGLRDQGRVRADVGAFFKRLRPSVGHLFPYLWVPEWHSMGHGLHVHFATGRFVHYLDIRAAWPHGNIDIRLLGDLPVGSGTLGEARLAARYLSKYVGKALDEGHEPGRHRYDVAQGFQPRRIEMAGATAREVIEWASTFMGNQPVHEWHSSGHDGWAGPPAVFASWA